jgi:hypothetical protein
VRDAQQPRAHAPFGRLEARGAAPQAHEDFLRQLLGRRAIVDDSQTQRVDRLAEVVVELAEGVLVALRNL